MTPLAFDTETCLIRPALLAPPLVCITWKRPGLEARIEHWSDAKPRLRSWLLDRDALITGHFVAYDMAVICAEFPELVPLVFAAYRANRVTCTKKRQQLLDIAAGCFRGRPGEKGRWITHEYSLEALSRRLLGRPMVKDGWRLEYANFRDVPIDKWPERAKELQGRARVRRGEIGHPANALASAAEAGPAAVKSLESEIKNLDAIIADVPEGVIRYPLEDASTALDVFQVQEVHAAEYLKDQYRQAYADFVLYLSSAWGLRTYGPGVEALRAELQEAYGELEAELQAIGLVRGGDDKKAGTRDMKAVKALMIATCKEYGLPLRRTDGHTKKDPETGRTCAETIGDACEEHVCLDSDACEAVVDAAHAQDGGASDSPFMAYAEFVTIRKMLSNDVEMLSRGVEYPIHTRYDLAETGRTTSSGPNIQNLNTGRMKDPKSQSTAQRLRKGVRQAFIPRPGKVFAQADFPQLELYTLAQCCYSWLGQSKLGDALNAGRDPHLDVAAKIVGCSYEEAAANKDRDDIDHARQVGKVFNFGKPGGLGAAKLIMYARKTYNVTLTKEQVDRYTTQWKEAFPEMWAYFARVNALFCDGIERAAVKTLFTERHRGGATYCAACNNGFQALGVDCAKAALCLVAEAEYCDTLSPLFGARTVAFVHDELIVEVDDAPSAHDAAMELGRLMVEGANRYLPNVPIKLSKMKPVLMRQWAKGAKQVFENGRLVPWAA